MTITSVVGSLREAESHLRTALRLASKLVDESLDERHNYDFMCSALSDVQYVIERLTPVEAWKDPPL